MATQASSRSGDHQAPTRAIARAVTRTLERRGPRWLQLLGADILDDLLLEVTLSASIAGSRQGYDTDDADRRPLSAMAIAQSTGVAYTTVRRRTAALCNAGKLSPNNRGLIAPRALLSRPEADAVIAGDAHDLRHLAQEFAALRHPPAVTAADRFPHQPDAVLSRLLLDFNVRILQHVTELYGGFTRAIVGGAIIGANVRHIAEDPVLTRRYATSDNPPCDHERRPVSLRAIARMVSLPLETVRRQVHALEAAQFVERREGGFVVPTRAIVSPRHHRHNLFIQVQFDRMLMSIDGSSR